MKVGNGCYIVSFIIGVVVIVVYLTFRPKPPEQEPKPTANPHSSAEIPDIPIALTPGTPSPTGSPSSIATEISVTPSALHPCDFNYPESQLGWQSTYKAENPISVRDLYSQTYATFPRDNYDLYTLVYYNNRKALETNNYYHAIDPINLNVEEGWQVFLPPFDWIEQYRIFPRTVLSTSNTGVTPSTLSISGTSVLYPLSSQIANCFENATKIPVLVKPNSARQGLTEFCRSVTDAFAASPEDISQKMIEEAGCQGVDFKKFQVVTYTAVVFIHNQNPYASDLINDPLNPDELQDLLFSAKMWSDIRISWGDELIQRYFPSRESGTFEIVKNELYPNWSDTTENPAFEEIDDENALIQEVIDHPDAIGFTGYDAYQANTNTLIAIPIKNISPNLDTINGDNPSYPLTRQLYLYTGPTTYAEQPLLQYFINYYLTYELDFIEELGYFKPSLQSYLDNPDTIP